jgi:CHAT domain-containing protein
MSLWNVNDRVVSDFMSKFYELWLSGNDKQVAFRMAQNYLREEYENPYYWAAFIMLD